MRKTVYQASHKENREELEALIHHHKNCLVISILRPGDFCSETVYFWDYFLGNTKKRVFLNLGEGCSNLQVKF